MKRREFLKNFLITGISGCALAEYGASSGQILLQNVQETPDERKFPLRPPGALPEDEFLARCIRCMRCMASCPNNAIIPIGDSFGPQCRSTPTITPRRQACMLCNKMDGDTLKCTDVCPTGALQKINKTFEDITQKVAMGKAHIDKSLCYSYNSWSCGACYRACPLPGKAMKLGLWEKPDVVKEECIGCGACVRACIRYPHAIRVKPRGSE